MVRHMDIHIEEVDPYNLRNGDPKNPTDPEDVDLGIDSARSAIRPHKQNNVYRHDLIENEYHDPGEDARQDGESVFDEDFSGKLDPSGSGRHW